MEFSFYIYNFEYMSRLNLTDDISSYYFICFYPFTDY